jgi:hypothetical protein
VGEIVGAAIIIGAVAWDLARPTEQGNPNYPGPWTTTKPDPTIPFYGPSGNSSYEPPDPEGFAARSWNWGGRSVYWTKVSSRLLRAERRDKATASAARCNEVCYSTDGATIKVPDNYG